MTMGHRTGLLLVAALLVAGIASGQSLHDLAAGDGQAMARLDPSQHVASCRAAVDSLAAALKGRLQQALADSGTIGALHACNVEAIPLTEEISLEEGVTVGRTSQWVRNRRNEPDPWERQTLEHFTRRLEQGERPGTLEEWTVQTDSLGHHTFRYMKAIIMKPLCLRCHGARLQPGVAARIAELYPDDRATGFHVGDLRGAFTVTKPLD